MIRKIKTIGLTAVAVLAMSAVVASAAQAQFTSNSYPTTVTGSSELGNDVFTFEGGTVECKAHYQGTLTEASNSLTLTPTYSNCKGFGFAHVTITYSGCGLTTIRITSAHAEFRFHCTPPWVIIIHAGTCEIRIGEQTASGSMELSNVGSHVNAKANVTGIAYEVTKDGFLCPFSGTGKKTGATFKQGSAVTFAPVSGGTSFKVD